MLKLLAQLYAREQLLIYLPPEDGQLVIEARLGCYFNDLIIIHMNFRSNEEGNGAFDEWIWPQE